MISNALNDFEKYPFISPILFISFFVSMITPILPSYLKLIQ
jgi:hypothetical protein